MRNEIRGVLPFAAGTVASICLGLAFMFLIAMCLSGLNAYVFGASAH